MAEADVTSRKVTRISKAGKDTENNIKKRLPQIAAVVALATIVAAILWLTLGRSGDGKVKLTTDASTVIEAEELFNRGNFKEAIPKLEVYVEEHPKDAEARSLFGQALWLKGNSEEAIDQFKAVLKETPDDVDTLYRLGVLYGQVGSDKESVDSLRTAVDIDPGQASSWAELAKAYTRVNKYDEAIDSWRRAFDLAAATNTSYKASIMAEIGNTFLIKKDEASAKNAYQEGLSIEPKNEFLKGQLSGLNGS